MLLDEPSSGLDVHETEQLGEALRRVRQERGTAFVLVEHNVEFVLDLSDRVTVLDFGKVLIEGTPDESPRQPRSAGGLLRCPDRRGRGRGPGVTSHEPTATDTPRRHDRAVRAARGHRPRGRVRRSARAVRRVVRRAARDRSPRCSAPTARASRRSPSAIAGVVKPSAGTIVFEGEDITGRTAHRVCKLGLAYVPENAQHLPAPLVCATTCGRRCGSPCRVHERKAALDRAFEMFPILAERRRQQAGTLSGGEQQMLALARVLAAPPKLLIADEMSLGLAPLAGRPRVRVARASAATRASPCCSSSSSWNGRWASPTKP